jgi:hypothetical protein
MRGRMGGMRGRMGGMRGRMGGMRGRGRGVEERGGRDITGSVRLKVSPSTASVFIDGTSVGTVSEFDGLTDHLKLSGGAHKIELRADGYHPYTGEITVTAGKTTTERVTLNKIK